MDAKERRHIVWYFTLLVVCYLWSPSGSTCDLSVSYWISSKRLLFENLGPFRHCTWLYLIIVTGTIGPCKNILSGVKFSRLNTKTAYILLFRVIFECFGVILVNFRVKEMTNIRYVPGFTRLYLALHGSAMIYLTIDCHISRLK